METGRLYDFTLDKGLALSALLGAGLVHAVRANRGVVGRAFCRADKVRLFEPGLRSSIWGSLRLAAPLQPTGSKVRLFEPSL